MNSIFYNSRGDIFLEDELHTLNLTLNDQTSPSSLTNQKNHFYHRIFVIVMKF
jgi:hypothetical protein